MTPSGIAVWSARYVRTQLSRPAHAKDAEAEEAIPIVSSGPAVSEWGLRDVGSVIAPRAKTATLTLLAKRGQGSAEVSFNASKRWLSESSSG